MFFILLLVIALLVAYLLPKLERRAHMNSDIFSPTSLEMCEEVHQEIRENGKCRVCDRDN